MSFDSESFTKMLQRHRGGADQRDPAQLGAGQAVDALDRVDLILEECAERLKDVRLGREQVLVQVVLARPARAESELATQQRDLGDPLTDLVSIKHKGEYSVWFGTADERR